jgi:PIN domain nuclease of toxin-antitoxin system
MPVLDASAVLALLLDEPGADTVAATMDGALVSATNLAEVVSRLTDRAAAADHIEAAVAMFRPITAAFDAAQAEIAGRLRPATRHLGLSLGDRACLALAITREMPVLTADRSWAGLDVGIEIEVIR